MWVVERIDEKGYYHLENLKTGETILKRDLMSHENDVLNECFHVLPEETKKRKQEWMICSTLYYRGDYMLINIQNLSYAIGERQLYKNLNMIVEDTDKIALVGVNGTGKSTLLK